MNITIYIPTRGRVGHEKQITLRELQASKIPVTIACPADEVARHRYYHDSIVAVPVDGIGPTRQWLIDNCPTQGIVMLDDDMYFSERRGDIEIDSTVHSYMKASQPDTKLHRCEDLAPMFGRICNILDEGYMHGGISARQGNQHIPKPWADCIRVNNAHFFDTAAFRGIGLKFDVLPVMEDFYVSLSLIHAGYPNRVLYNYCWSQRGSGAKGGCSIYRTAAMQAEAAEKLHELFPDYVRVVEKTSISGGELFSGVRKDVNIAWLKAWEDRPSDKPMFYRPATPDLNRR